MKLSIFQKMLVAPVVSILFYCAYLYMNYGEYKQTSASVVSIRDNFLPVMALSGKNVAVFDSIVNGFKDAVLARETSWLTNMVDGRSKILSNLEAIKQGSNIFPNDQIDQLAGVFTQYYANAQVLASTLLNDNLDPNVLNGLIDENERLFNLTNQGLIKIKTQVEEQVHHTVQQTNKRLDDLISTGIWIGLFIVLIVFILTFLLSMSTRKRLCSVVEGMKNLAQGDPDFSRRLDQNDSDELGVLAGWFNVLSDKHEEVNKYMEGELNIGRTIQKGFLPRDIPKPENWSIDHYFCSAREVAGDFYDVFEVNGHKRLGVIVADVCDKGVGAALFMTLFRSLLRSTAKLPEYSDIADDSNEIYREHPDLLLQRCLQFTNNYVAITHGHASMFSTVFFGLLEPETGHLFYVNAGHEAPLLISKGKIKNQLETTGPVIGLFSDVKFEVAETCLGVGDRLFIYTDGVTDATDEGGHAFSEERLISVITENANSQDLTSKVVEEVRTHIGDASQFDDITILTLQRNH